MRTSQGQGASPPPQQGHQSSKRKIRHSNDLQSNAENHHARARKTSTTSVFPQDVLKSRPDVAYSNSVTYTGYRSTGIAQTNGFSNLADRCTQGEQAVRSKTCTSPSNSGKISPARSPVPNLAYAGARFSDPPSPKVLPKPPTHWFCAEPFKPKPNNCAEMTSVLKVMLKVQC